MRNHDIVSDGFLALTTASLLLLCSSAGDWINGQSISVDGGWVMRL